MTISTYFPWNLLKKEKVYTVLCSEIIRNLGFTADIEFAADPEAIQAIDLQVLLVGRTSFTFRVNDNRSLSSILLRSAEDKYEIKVIPSTIYIHKLVKTYINKIELILSINRDAGGWLSFMVRRPVWHGNNVA